MQIPKMYVCRYYIDKAVRSYCEAAVSLACENTFLTVKGRWQKCKEEEEEEEAEKNAPGSSRN